MSKTYAAAKVDPTAEAVVIELLVNIFDEVAYMDPDTVRQNLELATPDGFSKSDRSIRVELANYLLSHFSIIFAGLVTNKEFRETFKEAVSVEIAIDSKDATFVTKIRNDMKDGKPRQSKGDFVINLSSYKDSVYKKLNGKLSAGFEKLTPYDETIGQIISELTDEDKIDIGFCVSNFMYLLRAFSKNQLFANYVKTVVANVQHTLGIEY